MNKKLLLIAVLAALLLAATQIAHGQVRLFDPADPATCADATNHKVYGTPGKVQYFSCDEGTTLHAFLDWSMKGKEGNAVLHGLTETQEQALALTAEFLKQVYGTMLDSPHPCPHGQMEKGLLKADKNGRPFVEVCGNIWSSGEGRYIVRTSKEGKAAIADFNRKKAK